MIRKFLSFKDEGGQEEQFPFAELIPDSHEYLFAFVVKDIEEIIRRTESYLASPKTDVPAFDSILTGIQDLHPIYSDPDKALSIFINTGVEYIFRNGQDEKGTAALKLVMTGAASKISIQKALSFCSKKEPLPDTLYSLLEVRNMVNFVLAAVLDESDIRMKSIEPGKREVLSVLLSSRWREILESSRTSGSISFYKEEGTVFPDPEKLAGLSIEDDAKKTSSVKKGKGLSLAVKTYLSLIPDSKSGIVWKYDLSHTQDLFEIELIEMVRDGVCVKRCRKCGKYCVYTPGGYEYCMVKREDGGSCYSDNLRFLANGLYKKAYRALYQLQMRNVVSKKRADEWHEKATNYIRNEADYNNISEEDVRKHLKALSLEAKALTKEDEEEA